MTLPRFQAEACLPETLKELDFFVVYWRDRKPLTFHGDNNDTDET